VGQRRRHLGQAVAEADIHDRNDEGRDKQAAEAASRQAIVPAEEVAGDDGTDAEGPQGPSSGEAPKAPLLEILRPDLLIGHALHALLIRHDVSPAFPTGRSRAPFVAALVPFPSGDAPRPRTRAESTGCSYRRACGEFPR